MKTHFPFITLFLILFSVNSFSQPGILDCDFNSDGKIITDFGTDNDAASSIAVQTDGKIIIAGTTIEPITLDNLLITRYTPDGNIDQTFATNGFDTLGFSDAMDRPHSVIIQPDEKILIAGSSYLSGKSFYFVVRYNANGSLDNSFGNNGKLFSQIDGKFTYVSSIMLAPDGKIFCGGSCDTDLLLFKLLSDGSIDNTFGTNGYVTTDMSPDETIVKIAIQSDGKILAAAQVGGFSTKYDFGLLRYNSNGTLDSTFSYDGKLFTSFGPDHDYCNDMCLAPDGKIFLAGTSNTNPTNSFALIKYNSNGSIDLSFNQSGKVLMPIRKSSICNSVELQEDGKILISGYSLDDSNNSDFTLVRLNINGSIDSTFGTDGIVLTDFGTNVDYSTCMAIQPDGRILLGGKSDLNFFNIVAIARYISGLNIGIIDFTTDANSVFIYPNPVNSETVIEYELLNDEILSVDLFDMNGKLIKTFISNETRNKGKHKETLNFDESIKAGNYILSLKNNSNHFEIKIIK
ncbi:MAG TPA: T9SS type A sorting domain-containing protein [Bacteroidales bacterium]|nr:T9SS type A sorting domain-containing protein [Bacteroidales bacterium]HPS17168.1 T9SS type A sorting domain-containing protein [Bacteroidales bacterium]